MVKKNKNIFKKIWKFLWKSDSVWSWIVDLILIFLIVKFILFPLFSLILSTSLPFVIIESGSMEHQGSFDSWFSLHGSWYLDKNITKETIYDWPWCNGLDKGDIIVVKGLKEYDYNIGDVIIFKVEAQKTPIIHRIVDITVKENEKSFSTKGDNNNGQWGYEQEIQKEQVMGKSVARIPKIGWVKLFFVDIFR